MQTINEKFMEDYERNISKKTEKGKTLPVFNKFPKIKSKLKNMVNLTNIVSSIY